MSTYVCEELGERQAVVASERPSQTRDGRRDTEQRDGGREQNHANKDSRASLGPGGLVVDLDHGEASGGGENGINVANAEENSDEVAESHDTVDEHRHPHGLGNLAWSIHDFVAQVKHTVETCGL